MSGQARGKRVHQRWAEFRFSVIGQLLAAPPPKGELAAAIAALAERTWHHPITDEHTRFGYRGPRSGPVAVGTRVTSRPPLRSVRARLCIRLSPWVLDGEPLLRPRMKDARLGEPVVSQPHHSRPVEVTVLTATP